VPVGRLDPDRACQPEPLGVVAGARDRAVLDVGRHNAFRASASEGGEDAEQLSQRQEGPVGGGPVHLLAGRRHVGRVRQGDAVAGPELDQQPVEHAG
jgi:hypothetical protein